MKQLRISFMAVIAMFTFTPKAVAQIDTKATLDVTINGYSWNKIVRKGDPVTIFSYKQSGETYSFGIYSDDYAGMIDLKGIPFDVDPKQLKKLPKNSKKKLKSYTEMACTKAREKALAGKYITTSPDILLTDDYDVSVSRNDPITIIGSKTVKSISGNTYFYYAIVKKNGAGICYNSSMFNCLMKDVPLPFLPSTDDPQVKAFIAQEKQAIKAREEAEMKAYYENQRKLEAEMKIQQKLLEEQAFENLKLMDPAYIEVKKIKMDTAGGNEVTIKFTNCSTLKIKYVYFTGYFFNAVGDKCRNEINGSTVWKYTGVGPVSQLPNAPDRYGSYIKYFHSDPLFYSKNARKFRLSSVTIEYMSGKKIVLSGEELDDRVDYTDY